MIWTNIIEHPVLGIGDRQEQDKVPVLLGLTCVWKRQRRNKINGWMGGRMDAWMNRWMEGRMDAWMHEWTV